MKKSLFLPILFFLAVLTTTQSCVSSCIIASEPKEAEVYINGRYKGKTPYKFSATISDETMLKVNIQKKGYVEVDTILFKDGKTNKFNRFLGYILVFPFDYDKKFKEEYFYQLNERKNTFFPENYPDVNTKPLQENSKLTKLKSLQEAYRAGKYTEKEYREIRKSILEGKD